MLLLKEIGFEINGEKEELHFSRRMREESDNTASGVFLNLIGDMDKLITARGSMSNTRISSILAGMNSRQFSIAIDG